METKPVKSSNIEAVGYDAKERRLKVVFKSGGAWHYDRVPEETYQALMAAESVGKYFRQSVQGQFKGSRA